jgi:anthranilate phosphoribosyltransferase
MAQALVELGAAHAMVVHSVDGMDEISAWAPSRIFEVRAGRIAEGVIRPDAFVIRIPPASYVRIENADQAVQVMCAALGGEIGAGADVLALNGGAAIYVGGGASSLSEGVETARAVLRQGLALKTLERMRVASRGED